MKYLFKILFLTNVLLVSACSGSNTTHNHPQDITGKQLFENHCAVCHNSQGTGKALLGVPANINSQLSDSEIRDKIRHGKGGNSRMEVFDTMPEKEAIKIVRHLRKLSLQ